MWKCRFDHITALDGRKVILTGPCFGVEFAPCGYFAGLECLKQHRAVTIEIQPDFIKVVGATAQRQIRAPIVGVAFQGHAAACIIAVDHIGACAQRDVSEGCVGEILALPLRAAEDGAHARQQREFAVLLVKGKADFARAGLFDFLDLAVKTVITRVPLRAQNLVGKKHIIDRHRRPVRESGGLSEGEFHPCARIRNLDCLGQQAIKCKRFVP